MHLQPALEWYVHLLEKHLELASEREQRFDMLFSQSVHGVFCMTLDRPFYWDDKSDREALLDYAFEHLRVTAVNNALCEQMNTTRDELLGSVPRDRWTGARDKWREHMRQLYNQGQVHHSLQAPLGDGRWLDVEGEYICTYDREGRVTGHYGLQRDVSVSRATAIDAAQHRERLELAILGADMAVWDMDLVARTIVFDPEWLSRFGYDVDGPTARSAAWWRSVIHPDDAAELGLRFADHLAGKTEIYRAEYRMRTAQGGWGWIMATGRVAERDIAGAPLRLVGIAVDMTERKELEARLVASERLVALGTLAAGVGHEINNPLTYVVLNLALISREINAIESGSSRNFDRVRGMLDQIRDGTERVTAIVRDLQSLARAPDDSETRIELEPIVRRCLQIANHQIRHRAQVTCTLGPTPPIRGSESRLVQVFLNLILNAAQALPAGKAEHYWIRVASWTADDGRAVVEVADNGVGIEPRHVTRIYDPFFTTKPIGEGTGLGLAICRNIVSGLGGEISVDSTPGRGSIFRVMLPPASPSLGAAAGAASTHALPNLRILVIDDEPIIGNLVKGVLREHSVVVETSARAALGRIGAGEAFDRILCDLMMPELTGMDFYEQIAGELRPKIVFLTGGAFTDRARVFLDQVGNRRLAKPFGVDELIRALG